MAAALEARGPWKAREGQEDPPAAPAFGEVRGRGAEDGAFEVVDEAGRPLVARRAVSCLVEPEPGDRVLYAGRAPADLWVLAVLERPGRAGAGPAAYTLATPGDLTVRVPEGRFTVAAHEGVDVVTPKAIAMTSKELEVRAGRGRMLLRRLEVVSDAVFGKVGTAKAVFDKVERIAERALERVGRSYRFIETAEHTRAGTYEVTAEDTMRLKGENTFVQADMLVKVDGDQIHLG